MTIARAFSEIRPSRGGKVIRFPSGSWSLGPSVAVFDKDGMLVEVYEEVEVKKGARAGPISRGEPQND